MKCILLLLVLKQVTSDILDRRYLPPPDAKLSGGNSDDLQSPLEYPEENFPETNDGFRHGITFKQYGSKLPSNQIPHNGPFKTSIPNNNYITSTHPSAFQTTSSRTDVYASTVPTSSSDSTFFNNFPTRSPKDGFVTNRNSINTEPLYFVPTPRPKIQTKTNYFLEPSKNKENYENSGYYYYVPKLKEYGDEIAVKRYNESNEVKNNGLVEYSNQVKSDDIHSFPLKTAVIGNDVENDEPYTSNNGEKTMIMNFRTNEPNQLTPKFGEFENKDTIPINQDKSTKKVLAKPFQTPLVRTNAQKPNKSSTITDTKEKLEYPKTTANPKKVERMSVMFDQRTNFPLQARLGTKSDRPQTESERKAVILKYDNVISPEGFSYAFDTSNGIHVDESGTAIDGAKVKGSYSFTGDDGKIYTVTYTADEKGFQPKGDHLPTAPPVPEAIKKIIEQAERDKAAGIVDDGSYDENKYGYHNYQSAIERHHARKKNRILDVVQTSSAPTKNKTNFALNTRRSNKKLNSEDLNMSQTPTTEMKTPKIPLYQMFDQSNSINMFTAPTNRSDGNNGANSHNVNDFQHQVAPVDKTKNINFVTNNDNVILSPENYDLNRNQTEMLAPSTTITGYNQNNLKDGLIMDSFIKTLNPHKNDESIKSLPNPGKNKQSKTLTSYDNGYFYVPPLYEFYENEPLNRKEKPFAITGSPNQDDYNVDIQSRTNLDSILDKTPVIFTQNPKNRNFVFNEVTQTPRNMNNMFPNDVNVESGYNNVLNESQKVVEYDEKLPTYSDKLDSPPYIFTTTPMPSSGTHNVYQPNNGHFYQNYQPTITNPGVYEQSLPPIFVENEHHIPSETPRISISQNVVTSTSKPGTESNGVNLEVNQNVKIFGFGKSKPIIATQEYPEEVLIYNDGFYTATTPGEELKYIESYPDFNYEKLSNPDIAKNNNFIPTENPIAHTDSGIVEPTDLHFEIQPQVDLLGVPVSSAASFNYSKDTELEPDEELTTSRINTNQSPIDIVIGEDFSGPKQPPRFDPESGYHYK